MSVIYSQSCRSKYVTVFIILIATVVFWYFDFDNIYLISSNNNNIDYEKLSEKLQILMEQFFLYVNGDNSLSNDFDWHTFVCSREMLEIVLVNSILIVAGTFEIMGIDNCKVVNAIMGVHYHLLLTTHESLWGWFHTMMRLNVASTILWLTIIPMKVR